MSLARNPASSYIFSATTVAEAQAAVQELERQFTIPCGHCEGTGVMFLGDPGAIDTPEVTCDACNGKKRVWRK